MVAGANWAYIELGWGGFWAWDPVENTSLMPWLAATVFLHTSRIQERDGRLRRWNAGFALLPFVLTILGVYLTRSGVTGSIHSFAEDPVIGKVLLSVAAAAGVASLVLVLRAPRGKAWEKVGLGRDTWVASGGVLLAFALLVITVGSAYPAYANVFLGRLLTVDSRFFLSMTYPLAVLLVFGLGFALKTRWSRPGLDNPRVKLFMGVAALVALLGLAGPGDLVPVGLLALAAGASVMLIRDLVKVRPRRRLIVAYLAHLMGGLSYSLTLHAFDIFRETVNRRLLALKINASRFTVTVSEYNRTFMVDHLPGVDAEKIRVSYNGIEL
jgi:cytochrome c-type biogenesis protein CcmF